MNKREVLHAFWSHKQAVRGGYQVYRGEDGREVLCTVVASTIDSHGYKWDDLQYLGRVVEHIRSVDRSGNVISRAPQRKKETTNLFTTSMLELINFKQLTTHFVGRA